MYHSTLTMLSSRIGPILVRIQLVHPLLIACLGLLSALCKFETASPPHQLAPLEGIQVLIVVFLLKANPGEGRSNEGPHVPLQRSIISEHTLPMSLCQYYPLPEIRHRPGFSWAFCWCSWNHWARPTKQCRLSLFAGNLWLPVQCCSPECQSEPAGWHQNIRHFLVFQWQKIFVRLYIRTYQIECIINDLSAIVDMDRFWVAL